MKEQVQIEHPSEGKWTDMLSSPPWQVRAAEITFGLALARYGDVPLAAFGLAVFLHGLGGPEGYEMLTERRVEGE